MIEIHQENVFFDADVRDLLGEHRLVLEELVDLEADLGVFVGIERSYARLGGAEGLAGKALLFELVEQDVIRHHDLAAVRDHQLRRGNPLRRDVLDLFKEDRDIECDAVADDVHHVLMKCAGR